MMKKPIRIKDIAAKAGVSTGTVDRVLHKRGNVSKKAQEKVLKVMGELGYERNIIASALAYNKTFKIAALLPDSKTDSYWEGPHSGVQSALKSVQHYGVIGVIYLFDLFDPISFLEKADEIIEDNPDAILFPPMFTKEAKILLAKCKEKGIPNVMINTRIENDDSLCYIGQDSYQSGVLAARLLNFGLDNNSAVIVLNLEKGSYNAQHLIDKENGFRDYFKNLSKSKIQVEKYDFEYFDDDEKMKKFVDNILVQHPNLVGIFVTNSRAYRLARAISPSQLDHVKIVGFDLVQPNLDLLENNKINFLINQNSVQQGYRGVMNLFNHFLLKEEVEKTQYLPLDIVVLENYSYYLQKQESFKFPL
jgi:LacI family transcriptional regulator